MIGQYYFNEHDSTLKFGIEFQEGTYSELLRLPKKKPFLAKNFSDQHGTKRLVTTPFFESITYNLPILHTGSTELDFYNKYNAFSKFLMNEGSGYFNFDVTGMNRRFKLTFDDMPSFDKLTLIKGQTKIFCESKITFTNDFPVTVISPDEDTINNFIKLVVADGGTADKELLLLNF